MSSSNGSGPLNNPSNPDRQNSSPGDGIRRIKTTNLFRVVNFELYAKPNLVVMTFGGIAITLSALYLAYMKSQWKKDNAYVAIAEDGSESLMLRKSKWD